MLPRGAYRSAASSEMDQRTQLGPHGLPMQLYGQFTHPAEARANVKVKGRGTGDVVLVGGMG